MNPTDMPWQVKGALAAFVYLLLALALGLAFWKGDTTSQSMLIGAIIGQFATVVGYYFGSSESSQKKDTTIAGMVPTNGAEPAPQMIPARKAP